MTALKLQSKIGSAAQAGLAPHIGPLYAKPGARIVGIIELAHVERTQPAPESDKDAVVTMKITQLEIPTTEQEGAIREAQRALFIARTARGTLDDDGQVELSEATLKDTAGLLTYIEMARLRAGAERWSEYARRVLANDKLTMGELRHEMEAISQGLDVVLRTATPDDQLDLDGE